ncbi:MAG: DUF4012 domain-containing protein [Candidatus Moranbacteria bacterium]|nr:DUF4012 domain-containing protein [Candidatus Moranbacteria bacterium]
MEKAALKGTVKFAIFLIAILTIVSIINYYFRDQLNIFLDFKQPPAPPVISPLPTSQQPNEEMNFFTFGEKLAGIQEKKTYLILFQNSMELRPGGGFIGSFGTFEIKDAKIIDKKIHNTAVFDSTLNNPPSPPYIIQKYFNTDQWGIRDSNWSLDFPTNAEKFWEIYQLSSQKKFEEIDGIIGITTNIFPYLIKQTGPITLEGVEGEFNEKNALEKLEYEVEVGYVERGIKKEHRKKIINTLFDKIFEKFQQIDKIQQLIILNDLKQFLDTKEIQLYLFDKKLHNFAKKYNWTGEIIQTKVDQDYLAVVDSNLGALKSDRCIQRNIDYLVDTTQEPLQATVTINYKHKCSQKNFMTDDYHSYLRIYAPLNATLIETTGFVTQSVNEIIQGKDKAVVEIEANKKVFGNMVFVPLKGEESYSFTYSLPLQIKPRDYRLYFQKQSGMNDAFLKVRFKNQQDQEILYESQILKDIEIERGR